ncbi:hypothetical protein KSP40_PGU008066 [Platanthera guangdongensis]|uniref:DNA-directed RNA polymerase I subunit rpa49 n=1 Tax=Platanthera guangdongensis TaxID=2320717 RepID=A0ABR2MPG8_9ASPA
MTGNELSMNMMSGKVKKKKRKKLKVEMEFLETEDHMAPIVGYFPSGYDPVAAGADPEVNVFRNKRRNKRLELVVRPSDSNVEFVGRNYVGEAAALQPCTQALGVLDKETQTLKIIPIAFNKILRLEPRVMDAIRESPEAVEAGVINEKDEHDLGDLATLYGTKRHRNAIKKWRSTRAKQDDPHVPEPLEGGINDNLDDQAAKDIKEPSFRNIPPYDSSAMTPEDAYPLHKIISKGERVYLNDILETLESMPKASQDPEYWANNHYPSFVVNRLHKLIKIQDEAKKKKLACILSYITHLINFWKVAVAARPKANPNFMEAMFKYEVPQVVFQKFMTMFLDSNVLSSEKNELLISYILVLTLFADDFHTNSADIERDLAMDRTSLRPYFQQLGCEVLKVNNFVPSEIVLSVPLVFVEPKKRRYRRH